VAHLNAPSGEVRLARGLNAPSGEVRLARGLNAPSSEFCLARGLNAPSGEVRVARGAPHTRHPRSYSHVRAFNALTRLGITPQRCSTDPLEKTIPATIQHCAERPVSASWHCAAYFRTANTSSSRRGDDGTLEWGQMVFL
jgi:hypothetical protein